MAEPMTPEVLEAIRARLAAATPGPWLSGGDFVYRQRPEPDDAGDAYYADPYDDLLTMYGVGTTRDADFIAHAPEDIAALLAEVERLRARNVDILTRVRERIAEVRHHDADAARFIEHLADDLENDHA